MNNIGRKEQTAAEDAKDKKLGYEDSLKFLSECMIEVSNELLILYQPNSGRRRQTPLPRSFFSPHSHWACCRREGRFRGGEV